MIFNWWMLNRLDRKAILLARTAVFLVCVSLGLVSCSSPATPMVQPGTIPNDFSTTAPTSSPGEQNLERIYPTLPEGLERVDGTQPAPTIGEVPADLLGSILQDLARLQGIDAQQIDVIRAEAVTWPDGSLGCPQPGEYYTQEPVNGYWIILEVDTTQYDYRASERGYFTMCEQPLPLAPPVQPDQ